MVFCGSLLRSVMSPLCRASVLSLSLLACFLQVLSQGAVFRGAPQARSVFLRSKRANTFLVEEILQGNLERECYEEICSYEEAREYFENTARTKAFWNGYHGRDKCHPNPCLHGGSCTDKMGEFLCSCRPPYYGPTCELGGWGELGGGGTPATAPQLITSECPTEGPTACHQFCSLFFGSFSCSCAAGFKLQTDGQSCLPEVEFPCGRVSDKLTATGPICHHGNCPWQVSLVDSGGAELCGGVVLGRRSVLTAASCLFPGSGPDLRPSSLHIRAASAVLVSVQALFIHSRFRRDRRDDDLVLLQLARPLTFGPALSHLCLPTKDFSENVLMRSGRTGLAGGRPDGKTTSDPRSLVYVTLDECRSQLNVSHPISNKMFCMRIQNGGGRQNQGERHNDKQLQTGTERKVRALRSTNSHQSQNGGQGSPNGTLKSQNGAERHDEIEKHNGRRLQTETENQNRSAIQNGRQNPAEAGGGSRSEVSGGRCGLLPGTPVATAERGTVFLTGLLISPPADCGEPGERGGRGGRGLVFTKLSRYLAWISQRLKLAEDHMTSQVSQYPEER
ncbi:protein Z, vitamin K-dependent plasma glycoprotein b [Centroberyx affinis]|uniref:protein Z, vitamin K-dependent plasma glycoprotein b n=1 Tax=Centroberyx affinis TaxID=166261 RepID=UPI003A5BA153